MSLDLWSKLQYRCSQPLQISRFIVVFLCEKDFTFENHC